MKSNIEYLREFIKDNEEANEFLDAIVDEIKVLKREKDECDSAISNLEDEVSLLEHSLESEANLDVIDCGIGEIFYRTDNLKLQMIMEDFKEKHSVHAY